MNQTNIKQWAYAHRELFFLNYDLLDTLYQSALYINQIFFFPNINQISFFFPRNSCITYKKKRMHRINHLHVFIYLIAIPVDC